MIISQTEKLYRIIVLAVFSLAITSCQTGPAEITSFSVQSTENISVLMPRMAQLAGQCFTGKGKPFTRYRVSSELNSLSGQPRLLLVSRDDVQGLPALVILGEAESDGTKLSVFGRLLGSDAGGRTIDSNVRNWADGGTGCA